jgi:hypothetical protein
MTSNLVFSIAYFHIFEYLMREMSVDFKMELVFVWYPSLWRQKTQYNFYAVHNIFLSKFKKIIFGHTTSRLSLEAISFLIKK